jgi:hypothetical protein
MGRRSGLLVVVLLVAACGGGDGGSEGDPGGGDSGGGSGSVSSNVVDRQEPGEGYASVAGREYNLVVSPALPCEITPEAVTFSFWVGDNSIVLGGGANLYDDGWLGSMQLTLFEPDGEEGPIYYYPDFTEHGDRIGIAGDSMSYSGPLLKQPANDGSNPPPVDAGNGTFSATCG